MKKAIIFLHWGSTDECLYLNYAALQARLWNPGADIYLIADADARQAVFTPGITVIPLEKYLPAAGEFRSLYTHHSFNAPAYTRFNIERWFYIRELAREKGLDRILHLDSDVLLYADIEEAGQQFLDCDLTLSSPAKERGMSRSGHSSFISRQALDSFCDFVLSCYADEAARLKLEQRYVKQREAGFLGNIGDMHLLGSFAASAPHLKVGAGRLGNPAFDGNFRHEGTFESVDGHKRVEFREGQPYCFQAEDGQAIRFASLHFQGPSKKWMADYLQAPGGSAVPADWLKQASLHIASRTVQHRTEVTSLHQKLQDTQERLASLEEKQHALQQSLISERKARKPLLQGLAKATKLVAEAASSAWVKSGTSLRLTHTGPLLEKALDHLRRAQSENEKENGESTASTPSPSPSPPPSGESPPQAHAPDVQPQ